MRTLKKTTLFVETLVDKNKNIMFGGDKSYGGRIGRTGERQWNFVSWNSEMFKKEKMWVLPPRNVDRLESLLNK